MAQKKKPSKPRFEKQTLARGVTKTITRRAGQVVYQTTIESGGDGQAFRDATLLKSIEEQISGNVQISEGFLQSKGLPFSAVVYRRPNENGEWEIAEKPTHIDFKARFNHGYLDAYFLGIGFGKLSDEVVAAQIIVHGSRLLDDRETDKWSIVSDAMEYQRAIDCWGAFQRATTIGKRGQRKKSKSRN